MISKYSSKMGISSLNTLNDEHSKLSQPNSTFSNFLLSTAKSLAVIRGRQQWSSTTSALSNIKKQWLLLLNLVRSIQSTSISPADVIQLLFVPLSLFALYSGTNLQLYYYECKSVRNLTVKQVACNSHISLIVFTFIWKPNNRDVCYNDVQHIFILMTYFVLSGISWYHVHWKFMSEGSNRSCMFSNEPELKYLLTVMLLLFLRHAWLTSNCCYETCIHNLLHSFFCKAHPLRTVYKLRLKYWLIYLIDPSFSSVCLCAVDIGNH